MGRRNGVGPEEPAILVRLDLHGLLPCLTEAPEYPNLLIGHPHLEGSDGLLHVFEHPPDPCDVPVVDLSVQTCERLSGDESVQRLSRVGLLHLIVELVIVLVQEQFDLRSGSDYESGLVLGIRIIYERIVETALVEIGLDGDSDGSQRLGVGRQLVLDREGPVRPYEEQTRPHPCEGLQRLAPLNAVAVFGAVIDALDRELGAGLDELPLVHELVNDRPVYEYVLTPVDPCYPIQRVDVVEYYAGWPPDVDDRGRVAGIVKVIVGLVESGAELHGYVVGPGRCRPGRGVYELEL